MRLQATRGDIRRRPHWWSGLLLLFVVLSFAAQPTCLGALAEASPGHSHLTSSDPSHHSHEAAHNESDRATVSSTLSPHECCCDSDALAVVGSPISRLAAPEGRSTAISFAPAILPDVQGVLALSHCYGRDGPSINHLLRSQFSSSSLLGRAPPLSV